MPYYKGDVIKDDQGNKVVIVLPEQHRGKIFKQIWKARRAEPQPREPIDLTPYIGTRIEFEVLEDTINVPGPYYYAYGNSHISPEPEEVDLAINRFAPEVRLYPDDEFRPSSVPWYLSRVHMRRHRRFWPDVQVLNKGEVNLATLINQAQDDQHSGAGRNTTDFFLQIPNDGDEGNTRKGNLDEAICYVHFRRAPGIWDYDIQYWFFYPYNGDITPVLNPAHEGDWEHLTIRVSEDLQRIIKVFFATHKKESEWRTEGFNYNAEGHPIIYSSKYSHATYWNAGIQFRRDPLPDDKTAEGGPVWQTWRNCKQIGEIDLPFEGQEWIKYTGRWGELGFQPDILVTSGPFGPAFQPWWDDDDRMLD